MSEYIVLRKKDLEDLKWSSGPVDVDDFMFDLERVQAKIESNRSARGLPRLEYRIQEFRHE